MKPLCKWSGGKRDEIKMFRSYIPKEFNTYIEPFIGGGALYFDQNFSGTNVINDIHPELVNFYTMVKEGHAQEIYDIISNWPNNEQTYYYVRGMASRKLENPEFFIPSNNIEKAAQFFYLRRTCFRGMIRYNADGKFNIPYGKYKTVNFNDLLDPQYTSLLGRTIIHSGDYKNIFETYNSKDNFIFLDPPYDSEFNDYGFDDFNRQSQIELANIFNTTENKCMAIISETPLINELYKDHIKAKYPKKYSFKIYGGRVGEEIDKNHLIITNY
jgi:DNA adenine methylase